jgi:hypothetical protein
MIVISLFAMAAARKFSKSTETTEVPATSTTVVITDIPFTTGTPVPTQTTIATTTTGAPKPTQTCSLATDKLFSPYVDILAWPTLKISDTFASTNIKHNTLAFMNANSDGEANWGGYPIGNGVGNFPSNYYEDEIKSIRANGGDITVSFGGTGNSIAKEVDIALLGTCCFGYKIRTNCSPILVEKYRF